MKLTDLVRIWDLLPDFEDNVEITFEEFVNAVEDAVGVENDILALGGEKSGT